MIEKRLDLSLKTETISEEDIKPSSLDDTDHSSLAKPAMNERAKACEDFLSQLRKLDSEGDIELEKKLKMDQHEKGNQNYGLVNIFLSLKILYHYKKIHNFYTTRLCH